MPLKHPLFGCNGKFVLLAAHDGPGMQPGRAEASPIKPKKLVSSSARTLCERVRFSPSLPHAGRHVVNRDLERHALRAN